MLHITGKQLAIGAAVLGGATAVALVAAGCTANVGKTPEGVAADTMHKFDSGLPFTNTFQLDTRTESSRIDFDGDFQVRGTWSAARLLDAADRWDFGKPENADPSTDKKADHKATFNEIVQVVRHFDADASGKFDKEEAKDFNRNYGIKYDSNPFYRAIPHNTGGQTGTGDSL